MRNFINSNNMFCRFKRFSLNKMPFQGNAWHKNQTKRKRELYAYAIKMVGVKANKWYMEMLQGKMGRIKWSFFSLQNDFDWEKLWNRIFLRKRGHSYVLHFLKNWRNSANTLRTSFSLRKMFIRFIFASTTRIKFE